MASRRRLPHKQADRPDLSECAHSRETQSKILESRGFGRSLQQFGNRRSRNERIAVRQIDPIQPDAFEQARWIELERTRKVHIACEQSGTNEVYAVYQCDPAHAPECKVRASSCKILRQHARYDMHHTAPEQAEPLFCWRGRTFIRMQG